MSDFIIYGVGVLCGFVVGMGLMLFVIKRALDGVGPRF